MRAERADVGRQLHRWGSIPTDSTNRPLPRRDNSTRGGQSHFRAGRILIQKAADKTLKVSPEARCCECSAHCSVRHGPARVRLSNIPTAVPRQPPPIGLPDPTLPAIAGGCAGPIAPTNRKDRRRRSMAPPVSDCRAWHDAAASSAMGRARLSPKPESGPAYRSQGGPTLARDSTWEDSSASRGVTGPAPHQRVRAASDRGARGPIGSQTLW